MSQIKPPTRIQVSDPGRRAWHELYRPTWRELVSLGYVNDAAVFSYGGTIEGLSSLDGQVAFREGTPLAFGADLSASTVYLVSSAAGDTQDFSVQGLDADNLLQIVDVTATGTTPVAVSGTWNHIQRVVAKTTPNVGTVYVSTDAAAIPTTAGDQIQCVMLPAASYAINPLAMAAADQYILIYGFDFSTANRDTLKITIEANRQGNWIQNFVFYTYDSQYHQQFQQPLYLQPGDGIRVLCEATSGTDNAATFGMNAAFIDRNLGGPSNAVSALWED
jgi:hypothetical protein